MKLATAATAVSAAGILGFTGFHGVSAFTPPNTNLPHGKRVTASSSSSLLHASLSDQLSQLNYDGAFAGKMTGSVKSSVSTVSTSAKAAAASTSASSTGAKAAAVGGKAASASAVKATAAAATATATAAAATSATSTTTTPALQQTVEEPTQFTIPNAADLLEPLTNTLTDLTHTILTTIQSYESQIDQSLTSSSALSPAYLTIKAQLLPLLTAFTNTILHPSIPPSLALLIASYVTYSIVSTLLSFGEEPPPGSPYPMNKYDPNTARRYFDDKWPLVLARAIQVTFLSGTYLASLGVDSLTGKLQTNSDQRAQELSVLLTKLGPSFIKIGQSLSIRTDLLSPAYVRGLKSLQDQVPPFDTKEARQIIEEELGERIEDLFVEFPEEPIAAASLGQVYRAKIRVNNGVVDGVDATTTDNGGSTTNTMSNPMNAMNANTDPTIQEVAVKVQRPNIMNQIALDMHLIREIAAPLKRTFNLNSDLVGTVDAWGAGFVDELDYIEEAINAKTFLESIERTPLAGVVFSPPVVDEWTTRRVLTTEWVVGERLDRSGKEDVSILCSIAMNTYLTMMLETGVLHCDPHPGNLLRTTDGKLCILDWGMVTRLAPDLQLTLIEHMAHLTSADYEEIPQDLLLLGFIPESKKDLIKDSGVVETLAEIYGAWTAGGGAAAINVNKVVAQLQDLTAEKGNLFQIPPYFAYIAKSFSVLEGIGLSNDPKYSIINECLPYVSKRLLTDKSERTGGALSTFIFGPNKNNQDRIIDYDRVEQLVSGFGDYTTSASGELLGKNTTRAQVVEGLATQVLDLLATEEETPLQQIFIEQLAKIITSSSRSVWSQLRERSGVLPSGRTVLGTLVDPLGLFRTSPVVRPNELDERTVETTRNLLRLLTSDASGFDVSSLSNAEIVEISSIVVRTLWERRSGVLKTSNRLAMQLLQLTADRLDRGEREILVVPVPNTEDPMKNDGRIHEESNDKKVVEKVASDRLKNARRILATVENS